MKKIVIILLSLIWCWSPYLGAQTPSCLEVIAYVNQNSANWKPEDFIRYMSENKDKFDFDVEADHWLYNFAMCRVYYFWGHHSEALEYLPFVNEFILANPEEFASGAEQLFDSFYWEANSLFNTGAPKEVVLSKLYQAKEFYESSGLTHTQAYQSALDDIRGFDTGAYEVVQMVPVAMDKYLRGDHVQAAQILEELLSILRPSRPIQETAPYFQMLGTCYVSMGRLSDAEGLYLEAIKEINDARAYDLEAYRYIADALGVIYTQVHNYRNAKSYCLLSKRLHEKNLDFDDSYIRCLSNLSLIDNALGNLFMAKAYVDVALKHLRNNIGISTADQMVSSLGSLSNIAHYDEGKVDNFRELSVLETQRRPLIQVLSNASVIYQAAGFWPQALKSLQESITLAESIGEENLFAYNNLGVMNIIQGNYSEAVNNFDKAVSLCYNPYSSSEILFNRALALWVLKSPLTVEAATAAADAIRTNIDDSFIFLSEAERTDFWKHFDYYLPFLNQMIYDTSTAQDYGEVYNNILTSKGILLRRSTDLRNAILNSGSQQTIDDFNRLLEIRQRLMSVSSQEEYSALKRRSEALDKRLSRTAGTYADIIEENRVSWQDVRNSLGDKDIAIEFYNIPLTEPSDFLQNYVSQPRYVAVILKKGYDHPHIVPLCTEQELCSISDESLYDTPELYNLVWRPLESELKGVENIYFSPDRELYKIAVEYAKFPVAESECVSDNEYVSEGETVSDSEIVSDQGSVSVRELMSDKYNMYRLSSTRELLSRNTTSLVRAVLYGGLDYDLDTDSLIALARASQPSVQYAATRAADLRGIHTGIDNLPQTLIEVNQIASLFPKGTVQVVVGADGTEESFRSLQGSDFDVVHLSTHGFFWGDKELSDISYMDFIKNSLQQSSNKEDMALTLSGLFFSGANIALSGETLPADVEDGILTAKEISDLNLGNIGMVVLSACQTGLGETTGEGVFGLQRGFKLAGAKSLLMSLWEVDDNATRILMVEFYKHLLSGNSKVESLRQAQAHLRNIPGYEDPQFWAGWVLLDALD